MNQGLMTVAFGDEYQELAIHAIAYSQQFTDLPWVVLVNEPVNPKWEGMTNVTLHSFDEKQTNNRLVKTQMCRYTPFSQTLYIDCDAVIRRKGIEKVFELLETHDIFLNHFATWKSSKIIRLYATAMKLTDAVPPIDVYNGAFIGWNSTGFVERFFKTWRQTWNKTGKGRDMPPLACSLQKSGLKVGRSPVGFFEPDFCKPECVVQHAYAPLGPQTFYTEFNLPEILRPCKPFDTNVRDWDWVQWKDV